jgi:hypothetical protein
MKSRKEGRRGERQEAGKSGNTHFTLEHMLPLGWGDIGTVIWGESIKRGGKKKVKKWNEKGRKGNNYVKTEFKTVKCMQNGQK